MRIAIAQLNFLIGAFSANFAKMAAAVNQARAAGADLVLFSELATTGYPPGDLLDRDDFVELNLKQLERVAALSDEDLAIIIGFVDRSPHGVGKALRNAAALCSGGQVVDRYYKCLLPSYDVFDEARYFEPGTEARPLIVKGVKLGVTVCEDLWSDPDLWSRQLYGKNPVAELVAQGAQVLINISASPFALGKAGQRRQMIGREAAEHGCCFFYANQVGGNDELVFDGHSLVCDGTGKVVARASDFAEDLICHDLPETLLGPGKRTDARPGDVREVAESEPEEALRALVLGLGDYATKSGFDQAVLGLSGGIDSALTAVIASAALGPENVLGVALPTRYSSSGSVRDAEALAENLGIKYQLLKIDDIFQSYLDGLAPVFGQGPGALLEKVLPPSGELSPRGSSAARSGSLARRADAGIAGLFRGGATTPAGRRAGRGGEELLQQGISGLTEENIQARIRGSVLMALSNNFHRLLLATGNKSELAVGYCTLYGDMCGGLAVIGDVPKTLVYELAHHINRDQELIPRATLLKAPSAELRPDQKDQDSLPPYELLDQVVAQYVEAHRSVAEIVATGLDPAAVEQVVYLIDRNEYKRRQAAPGIKISAKAFGVGRRNPIVADYQSLNRRGCANA